MGERRPNKEKGLSKLISREPLSHNSLCGHIDLMIMIIINIYCLVDVVWLSLRLYIRVE